VKKRGWKETFLLLWDILFVLILCFAILLATMLLTKSESLEPFTGYHVSILRLSAVAAALSIYLGFMLRVSLKGLRVLVENYFKKKEGNAK
jgi:hypothetical protein